MGGVGEEGFAAAVMGSPRWFALLASLGSGIGDGNGRMQSSHAEWRAEWRRGGACGVQSTKLFGGVSFFRTLLVLACNYCGR